MRRQPHITSITTSRRPLTLFLVCVLCLQAVVALKTPELDGFRKVSDEIVYDNWRRLIRRRVATPSNQQIDFEVVAQKGSDEAVVVFVWHTKNQTTTLIREYMPAPHSIRYGLPAGMVESDKHESVEDAARQELAEECRLMGGKWIPLANAPVTMDKYSTTRLSVFLVLDPDDSTKEPPRDSAEEGMEIVSSISLDGLLRIMHSEMTIVGSWATLLALRKLNELGLTRK